MLGMFCFMLKINAYFLILGEKPVTPVQLKGIDTDLASQFVFSPPVLRSRKRQISSISRIVEELVSNISASFSYQFFVFVQIFEENKIYKFLETIFLHVL